MEQEMFVVFDFVVQPHPERFRAAKESGEVKPAVKWRALVDRVVSRTKELLIKAMAPTTKVRATVEMVGLVSKKDHAYLASVVVQNPTYAYVMGVEDFLRAYVEKGINGDIQEDTPPTLTLKVRDEDGHYLTFQVTDFTLSGPEGGDWKPFKQWYQATKILALPQN